MTLPYLEETITSPDGIECRVLDGLQVDFSTAVKARKSAETLVKEAQGGEPIHTKNTHGQIESTYIAQKGDAIFVNLHNPDDVYVPGNPDGTRWQFQNIVEKGYEVTAYEPDLKGVRVKSTNTAKVLYEVVTQPTCIKDAWGAGQHQFLFAGATLKSNDNGRATGIDKTAFDATWETLDI